MSRFLSILGTLLAAAGTLACASGRVQTPPHVDLATWRAVGIVAFTANGDPALAAEATQLFLESVHQAQPGARIVELGSESGLLGELGLERLDAEALRVIGERHEVDALFTGALALSEVAPDGRVGRAFASLRGSAEVSGRLVARLLETRSGATVWSGSAEATESAARVGTGAGSRTGFRIGDPGDPSDGLVARLVERLIPDFHPGWHQL